MIKTSRLQLRNLRESDIPLIHAWRNDPACFRYQRWEATSEEAVTAYVKEYENSRFLSEEEEQHYAVCAGETLIGEISCFYTESDRCITLGITVSAEHQRKGYAREILAAVIEVVQKKFPKLDVVALIDRENSASIALFESLGFYRECYAPKLDSYVYVIDAKLP